MVSAVIGWPDAPACQGAAQEEALAVELDRPVRTDAPGTSIRYPSSSGVPLYFLGELT